MLWEVDVFTKPGLPDREGERLVAEAHEAGLHAIRSIRAARAYLFEGDLDRASIERIAAELLVDPVIEKGAALHVSRETLGTTRPAGGNVSRETLRSVKGGTPGAGDVSRETFASRPGAQPVLVLRKPGVMDPVALSCERAVRDLGIDVRQVRTFRKYWVQAEGGEQPLQQLAARVLANDAIEQVVFGELALEHLGVGTAYEFRLIEVPLREMDDAALATLSREGQLFLSLDEMRTIRGHFRELGRDPTDAELETLAQTWSEHCSHKTLKGGIRYEERDAGGNVVGRREFANLLKETIFAATEQVRRELGAGDFCVSVFEDNAGIVRFDEEHHVCFKVETHNHPSAIEPYGGANTGLGGVIRDVLGTGLGAKPVASTDVFCFAPPDYSAEHPRGAGCRGQGQTSMSAPPTAEARPGGLPPGVLHPKRVMKGVVAGVRDYGNRMGIPTVNGAIYFDERYLGNPLVFCGNVGLLPKGAARKQPRAGDLIVAVGGRTGRDGIHGATFSSAELTHESEQLSGGAVQIGNAITEKMVADVLLAARDRGLYTAITDCGAGGFSSAVGEMGAEIGAEVHLERAPLKYEGLSYSEIWISESQERMVLAVPAEKWPALEALCRSEDVEATVLGEFKPTGRLVLLYEGNKVAELDMRFLHGGRPKVVREAVYVQPARVDSGPASPGVASRGFGWEPSALSGEPSPLMGEVLGNASPLMGEGRVGVTDRAAVLPRQPSPTRGEGACDFTADLHRILGSLNVCSKEWVIRQYDHEVQGGSVVKPLVGAANDGPSDGAVLRPVLGSRRGLVIACGMNPRYGDLDPYWMAAAAVDEAVRNCVAVGADPARIALLDNFCWGNTDRPEQLGALVRAALGASETAVVYGTPFISGKDSLNNEFTYRETRGEGSGVRGQGADAGRRGGDGAHQPRDHSPATPHHSPLTISIPPTLLISALGQVDDVEQCVTMDFKEPGNLIYLIGETRDELGGSHWAMIHGQSGGQVPTVNAREARVVFRRVHEAIRRGLVRACHDLSEGGLAAALAEMCFAGGLGAEIGMGEFAPASRLPLTPALSPRGGEGASAGDVAWDEGIAPRITAQVLLFSESPSRFLMEVGRDRRGAFEEVMQAARTEGEPCVPLLRLGEVTEDGELLIRHCGSDAGGQPTVLLRASVAELKESWQRPLRW